MLLTFFPHRLQFFTLLRAINQYCFQAFFMIPPQHFKLVIDSVVWAFKHRNFLVADTQVWATKRAYLPWVRTYRRALSRYPAPSLSR